MGLLLVVFGAITTAAVFVVPIPDFDDLEARMGILIEARRERFTPCRRGDCTRTMVTVDHAGSRRVYHFGDADPALLEAGAPITVWTSPEFRGFDRVRVWHAEQDGRVARDYAVLASADRRLRLWLMIVAPPLMILGVWLMRTYDWRGRRVR